MNISVIPQPYRLIHTGFLHSADETKRTHSEFAVELICEQRIGQLPEVELT